jgi:hypothetical protein
MPPTGQLMYMDRERCTLVTIEAFNLGVGHPPQLFRCVPALLLSVVVLPVEYLECNNTLSDSCNRRTTFYLERSTSYKTSGLLNVLL